MKSRLTKSFFLITYLCATYLFAAGTNLNARSSPSSLIPSLSLYSQTVSTCLISSDKSQSENSYRTYHMCACTFSNSGTKPSNPYHTYLNPRCGIPSFMSEAPPPYHTIPHHVMPPSHFNELHFIYFLKPLSRSLAPSSTSSSLHTAKRSQSSAKCWLGPV